jgi:GNAT superfamily N-acetyltransferase
VVLNATPSRRSSIAATSRSPVTTNDIRSRSSSRPATARFWADCSERFWAKRLYVSILAVQEPFRSKGYGTELMSRAEQYTIERGGTDSWFSTFSFQARPLYERLGYRLFGTLENYPESHSLFFMTKRLVP